MTKNGGGEEGVFKDNHRFNLTKTLIIYVRIIILVYRLLIKNLNFSALWAPYNICF